jgi:hypothetical protein
MFSIVNKANRGSMLRLTRRARLTLRRVLAVVAIVTASGFSSVHAGGIYGTLSNFDIYNTTPEPSEGAEIELEGIHASSIGGDFPAHYSSRTITEYTDSFNNFAGTRITYKGYNFPGAPTPGSLLPNPSPTSTNGHALTYTAGGEHFGFWLSGAQATATRFFWLNDNQGTYERIGSMPELVPAPTWTYAAPGNPENAPVVEAVVKVPEAEVHDQNPDSIWMKVFKTEVSHVENAQDLLERLVSGDPNDPSIIVPQAEIETEVEWELLEGGKKNGKAGANGGELGNKNNEAVLIRYEFYKYTGAYDDEHEPLSNWDETGDPFDIGERGDFIAANMVAALLVPEPSTNVLLGIGAIGLLVQSLRRRI